MAIPIAILDCDLLLHGRGQKTMDRFDLDTVSDNFLVTNFGFPRTFILYLVELLREVSPTLTWLVVYNERCIDQNLQYPSVIIGPFSTHTAIQSHQSRGPGVGRSGLLHIRLFPDVDGRHNRHQPGLDVEMCVQCHQSPDRKGSAVYHIQQVGLLL